jgi:membrane associated rhomboid family serine protease
VIDLNHILLFLAIASPLAVLTRAWRPGPTYRGWRIAALVVLIVTGISWLFFRNEAGYIAGGAWLALLFIPAVGLRRVAELAANHKYKSARKLATGLRILHPSEKLRREVELLRAFESRPDLAPRTAWPDQSSQDRHRRFHQAPAVAALILLNLAAFVFEIAHRNWQEPIGLHRLGALEPYAVLVNHEYWRLFTALFLHYDYLHLLFNLFALYVLGPPLERAIGALRFCSCYLISGLGSSIGVVALTVIHVAHADQLVGASGCIMGIVGAWAGFLLRHRHAPLARQRLGNILMIVAIQTAFDLSTPQVSMSAHLCGLITGFFLGLVISPRTGGSAAPSDDVN